MTRAALALAILSAWLLSRAVPTSRQRRLAAGLAALLAVDLVRLVGLPQWADHAASVGWYLAMTGVVLDALDVSMSDVFWSSAVFVSIAVFPVGPRPAFWAALAIQSAYAARFLLRRVIPGQVETVGLLLAASTIADVAGPWLCGRPHDDWWIGRYTSVVTWLAVVGWELRCWTRARGSVV